MESKSVVLLIVNTSVHVPLVYMIPSTETEVLNRVCQFNNKEIDYKNLERYTEEQRKTIKLLIDDEEEKYVGNYEYRKYPIQVDQIIRISMIMSDEE